MILLTFVHLQIKFKIFENKHNYAFSFICKRNTKTCMFNSEKYKYQNLFYRRKQVIKLHNLGQE